TYQAAEGAKGHVQDRLAIQGDFRQHLAALPLDYQENQAVHQADDTAIKDATLFSRPAQSAPDEKGRSLEPVEKHHAPQGGPYRGLLAGRKQTRGQQLLEAVSKALGQD